MADTPVPTLPLPQFIHNLYSKLREEYSSNFPAADIQALLSLSSKELQDCNLEIGRLQDSLQNLNLQIQQLTSSLAAFEAKQKRLTVFREDLQTLSKPCAIKKLPNEILGVVFEYACEKNLFKQSYSDEWFHSKEEADEHEWETPAIYSFIRERPASAISSVCMRWRNIALNIGKLWARIAIDVDLSIESGIKDEGRVFTGEGVLNRGLRTNLEAFLERSAPYPLFLSADIGKGTEFPFYILLKHAQRFKSFSCNIDLEDSVEFPILEELKWSGGKHSHSFLSLFANCPRLGFLTTTSLNVPTLLSHQITSLCLSKTHTDMRSVLNLFPKLTSLNLKVIPPDRKFEEKPVFPVAFPQLTSLTLRIKGYYSREPFAVFASHTFPSLQELCIKGLDGDRCKWETDTFQGFLTRSSCNITSFSIYRCRITDDEIISILQLLPSLINLCIDEHRIWESITPSLISRLHSAKPTDPTPLLLLPNLRYLKLVIRQEEYLGGAALVKMATSRWLPDSDVDHRNRIACLKSLVVCFERREKNEKVDEEVYAPLRDLDRMGMRVAIINQIEVHHGRKQLVSVIV